jgi:ABC-2 type transport system permease protein
MAVFPTIVRLALKRIFRYPYGLLLSLLIDPVVLVMNILLFTTIYAFNQSQSILGYSLSQMIWYFAATTFIWYWIYNFTDRNIARRILEGDLTIDLLRPVSIFTWELGFAVSLRLSGVIFEFIPSLFIYSLFFRPDFLTVVALLRFVIAAATAFLLFFAINFNIGLAGFYIQNAQAILAIKHIIIGAAAGAFIPLEFFPDAVRSVLNVLPFPYLFYWPVQFFINRENADSWAVFLLREGVALAWFTVLMAAASLFWRRAVRRYTDARG